MEYPLYARFDYRMHRFFKKLGIILITSPLVALLVGYPLLWIMYLLFGMRTRAVSISFIEVLAVVALIECFIFIIKYPFGPYLWLSDEGLYVARGPHRVLIPWEMMRNVEKYLKAGDKGQYGIRLTFDDLPLWEQKGDGWESSGTFNFDYCYKIKRACDANYWRGEEPIGYLDDYEYECECESKEAHERTDMPPYYVFIPDIFSMPLDDVYSRMIGLWQKR